MRHPLARFWWLILLGAVVAGVAAYLVVGQQPSRYEARVRLLVGDMTADFDSIRAAESLATTYAELAGSAVLVESAVADLELDIPPDRVARRVDAVTVGTSRVLLLTVTMEDPDQAQQVANALAAELAAFQSSPRRQLTILDAADDAEQIPPRRGVLVALAVIGGAVSAAATILVPQTIRAATRGRT